MDGEDLVAVNLPRLQRTLLTGLAVVNVCALRSSTGGHSGLRSTHSVTSCKFYGAVRSHFSKLASFEAILRSHFLGVVSESSGPPWLCLRHAPHVSPVGFQAVTWRPLVISIKMSPTDLYSCLGKDAAGFLFV